MLNCGVQGCMGRHYSRKETFGNASPSDTKQRTVYSSDPPASSLSSGTRGSHKRVSNLDITSTASKRAASQASAGKPVTLPEIDDKKSPVTRDSSVKMEVQL